MPPRLLADDVRYCALRHPELLGEFFLSYFLTSEGPPNLDNGLFG